MLETCYMLLDAIVNIIGGGGRGPYGYLITHGIFASTMNMIFIQAPRNMRIIVWHMDLLTILD